MMPLLNVDGLIVSSFLLLTLAVGLWSGRGVKSMREYAVANKQFGTGVLTMTMLATYITGAQGIGYVGYVFDDGILPVFSVVLCGAIITYLCIARYIAPNIQYFKGCWTLPELMGRLYGQRARLWMGILGTFYSVALVALQMIWLGYVGALFNLPSQLSIFLGGFFLVLYAARGGMKAVAVTDVLQFIAILVFVPLVAYAVLYRVGGIKALFSQVPTAAFDVLHHPSRKDYVFYCIWDLFPAFPLSFPFIQRMLMARDKPQLVNSYYISLSFLTVFYVLLTLIGLAAIVLRLTVDVNMPEQGSNVFVYIVKHYLPVGARGIIGAGFIAGVMSTADSFLHTAGVSLVHDVLQPRMKRPTDTLRLTRYLTFFLGLTALLLALCYKALPRDQYGGVDLGRGLNFMTEGIALVFTIPLVAGIMGLKTESRSFLVSSIITVAVFVFSRFYISNEFIIPVAIATNALSFFGTHYFQNQGFAVVNRAANQQTGYVWNPTWKGVGKRSLSLIPTPKKLLSYSRHSLEKYGANPTLFALFMSLSYMIPFFMYSYAAPAAYNWLLGIRSVGALLCVGLLLKSYWPKWLLSYFPTYYHFSLLYCLPFTASFIFFLEGSSIECLISINLAILLLITLVDWMSFIILTVLGMALGFLFYQLVIGPINLHLDFSTGYLLVYTLTFSTLIALIFSRRKEQHLGAKLHEIADHYHTMGQVGAHTHPAAVRIATMIDHQVQEMIASYSLGIHAVGNVQQPEAFHTATDCLHYFFPTALAVIQQGDQMTKQIVGEIKANYIAPQRALLSLQACVTTILKIYGMRHPQDMHTDLEEDYRIYTSFNHLQYAFIHVLRFLHAHHLGERVSLWIARQEGVHIRLAGQAVSSSLVQELFSLFSPQETTKNMGLAISRLLIEGHGGNLLCKTSSIPGQAYTEFVLLIPPAEMEARVSAEPT